MSPCNWAIALRTAELVYKQLPRKNSVCNDSVQEIVRHYTDVDESSRLRTGWFQLEHARTQELILRHLPPPPATIIDAAEAQTSMPAG